MLRVVRGIRENSWTYIRMSSGALRIATLSNILGRIPSAALLGFVAVVPPVILAIFCSFLLRSLFRTRLLSRSAAVGRILGRRSQHEARIAWLPNRSSLPMNQLKESCRVFVASFPAEISSNLQEL